MRRLRIKIWQWHNKHTPPVTQPQDDDKDMRLFNTTQIPPEILETLLREGARVVGATVKNMDIFCNARRSNEENLGSVAPYPPTSMRLSVKDHYGPFTLSIRRAWSSGTVEQLWNTILHEWAHIRDMQYGDLSGPVGWSGKSRGYCDSRIKWKERPEEQRAVALVEKVKDPKPFRVRVALARYAFFVIKNGHEFAAKWIDENNGREIRTNDMSEAQLDTMLSEWRVSNPQRRYWKYRLDDRHFIPRWVYGCIDAAGDIAL